MSSNLTQSIAIGIVVNHVNEVFIATRPVHTKYGGMLEFPGGKVESNELPEDALKRELLEEIGLEILKYRLFHIEEKKASSENKPNVKLYFYLVEEWKNTPYGKEGQDVKWHIISSLDPKKFPPLNITVIERLKNLT
ncbi:8-oxo-dGTP diphosphatase MutT [Thorsellia kenyensis]|uniref:8-oxo-dGTP diphosphatase n=1 Tax=Thorsellia kenyensis TaxID=1549888 RepID=A0ABV6CD04_9GAMM